MHVETESQRVGAKAQESPDGAPQRGRTPPEAPSGQQITLDSVVRFLLWAGALALVGWLLWYFAWIVAYLVLGGVLSYLLRPVVHRLQGLGLGHVPAILCTFVLVFGTLIFLVVSFAPYVVDQATALSQQVSMEALSSVVRSLERRLVEALPFLQPGFLEGSLQEISDTLFRDDRITSTVGSVVDLFTDILYAVLVVPFVAFFFLKDGPWLRHRTLQWIPNRYFEVTLAIIDKVETSLGRYLRALLIQCTSVALVASALLYLIGLNYAVAVGIFAGLANSIPYFGPFVGFIAGTLVGIVQTGDFSMVLPVFVAMGLTQLADNIFFQPLIFSKAAQTHPLVILFVVLIGAQLGGIIGMLIAIPLATMLRVIIEQVLWSLRNYRILRSSS